MNGLVETGTLARTERVANRLGYLGVLPFAACVLVAALTSVQPWRGLASDLMVAYGGLILSFLGGIHWGRALLQETGDAPRILRWSVLPSLLGLGVLLLPAVAALALLILGFVVLYQCDVRAWRSQDWFTDLRGRMTGLVVMLLALMLMLEL